MRSKPVILAALLLPAFLINLDTTLVNVALPALVRELHATTAQLQLCDSGRCLTPWFWFPGDSLRTRFR